MSEGEGISNRSGPSSAADPSMDEILASIRRVLSEEEAHGEPAAAGDELLLDAGMRIEAPASPPFAPPPEHEPARDDDMNSQLQGPEGLVGEQAATRIANSIGALLRSVSAERAASVSRAGVTIEDIVREEVRPVLKAWLDTHLPSLVERVVRAEINRVIERAQD
jgi:cell pole-organizing protein PopZ